MRKILIPTLVLAVLLPCLTGGLGFLTDLNGWWKVVEDDYRMIKIEQQGSDVAIFGTDQPVIYGTFFNDTMWAFITDPAPDTMIFVYANDTLHGVNEVGNPITLIRYIVDLNGWWRNIVADGGNYLKMTQQGSDVTVWDSLGGDGMGGPAFNGTFANDTLLIPVVFPGAPDTTIIVMEYAYDTLRGMVPGDDSTVLMVLTRMPYGLWAPIRCGSITVDGVNSDWDDSCMVADDPDNDATNGDPSADLDKLYFCHDSAYLYIRIDCVGEVAYYYDRYGIGLGRNLYGQWDYGIRIDYGYQPFFRNNVTGEETALDNAGRMDNTVECRVPLYLLEYLDRANVSVTTAYYDWDIGWQTYDGIELPVTHAPCLCGDANGSGAPNVDDAVYCINYIFKDGPAPWPLDAGDANCDHSVNVGDVVYVINYIYRGGAAPCCP